MKLHVLPLLVAAAVLGPGCARQQTSTEQRTEYRRAAQDRLTRLRADIDSLSARSAVAGESLRVRTEVQLERLRAQRDSAELALERLRTATGETWENTKVVTDRLLAGLEGAIATARSHIHTRGDSIRD